MLRKEKDTIRDLNRCNFKKIQVYLLKNRSEDVKLVRLLVFVNVSMACLSIDTYEIICYVFINVSVSYLSIDTQISLKTVPTLQQIDH